MEGTKACTRAIVCVLVCAALVAGQASQIPAVIFNASYDSVCPPDAHLDAAKTDISNTISDILSANLGCGGYGWRKIAYLNMSDPDQTCPGQWRLYEQDTIRACGRQESTTASCDSVQFSSNGNVYTEVCGRITGYQHASPDHFPIFISLTPGNEINQPYIDGVSITYGNPRKHIWSFFGVVWGYLCCVDDHTNYIEDLNFVGTSSFCDTGNPDDDDWLNVFFSEHPLWDGNANCPESTCCDLHSGPWFHTTLTAPTFSDLEIRICGDESTVNEDTPLELIEIYVK